MALMVRARLSVLTHLRDDALEDAGAPVAHAVLPAQLAPPAVPIRPERLLWLAVIADAIAQARRRPSAQQCEALAYVQHDPDCELVCAWAGVDVEVVRRMAIDRPRQPNGALMRNRPE